MKNISKLFLVTILICAEVKPDAFTKAFNSVGNAFTQAGNTIAGGIGLTSTSKQVAVTAQTALDQILKDLTNLESHPGYRALKDGGLEKLKTDLNDQYVKRNELTKNYSGVKTQADATKYLKTLQDQLYVKNNALAQLPAQKYDPATLKQKKDAAQKEMNDLKNQIKSVQALPGQLQSIEAITGDATNRINETEGWIKDVQSKFNLAAQMLKPINDKINTFNELAIKKEATPSMPQVSPIPTSSAVTQKISDAMAVQKK